MLTCVNDPSAGSPTETLLRLLLPLNVQICEISGMASSCLSAHPLQIAHRNVQSVGATGGVYKGQGRNQCVLLTRVY